MASTTNKRSAKSVASAKKVPTSPTTRSRSPTKRLEKKSVASPASSAPTTPSPQKKSPASRKLPTSPANKKSSTSNNKSSTASKSTKKAKTSVSKATSPARNLRKASSSKVSKSASPQRRSPRKKAPVQSESDEETGTEPRKVGGATFRMLSKQTTNDKDSLILNIRAFVQREFFRHVKFIIKNKKMAYYDPDKYPNTYCAVVAKGCGIPEGYDAATWWETIAKQTVRRKVSQLRCDRITSLKWDYYSKYNF